MLRVLNKVRLRDLSVRLMFMSSTSEDLVRSPSAQDCINSSPSCRGGRSCEKHTFTISFGGASTHAPALADTAGKE